MSQKIVSLLIPAVRRRSSHKEVLLMARDILSRRLKARTTSGNEYEKKRKSILLAAAEVFREKGYDAANGGDIAKKAGMDRASIYYYYRGKKEIFRDMVGVAVTDNVLMAEKIAAGNDFPSAKLRGLVKGLFVSYERHYPYLFVYVQEDMTRLMSDKSAWSTNMRSLGKRFDEAVIKIIQAGLDDGSFHTKANARLLAAGIIGMCNWSHRWFDPARTLDGNQVAAAFSDMVVDGLTDPGRNRAATRPRKPNGEGRSDQP
jgi:AcrR family transcriptional regulator